MSEMQNLNQIVKSPFDTKNVKWLLYNWIYLPINFVKIRKNGTHFKEFYK